MEWEVLRGVVRVSFKNADTEQAVVSRGYHRVDALHDPRGREENLRSTIFLAPHSKLSKDFTLGPS